MVLTQAKAGIGIGIGIGVDEDEALTYLEMAYGAAITTVDELVESPTATHV